MGSFGVVSFGAKADGKTDDTAAIQKALDATSKLGGVVRLMAGKFLVAGSLEIPVGVALAGSNQAPVHQPVEVFYGKDGPGPLDQRDHMLNSLAPKPTPPHMDDGSLDFWYLR